jgi:hypothetical protein
MDDEAYEAIYQAWYGGMRSAPKLAAKFGWSDEMIRSLVNVGNPRRHWLSFKARATLEVDTARLAENRAAAKIADLVVSEWEKAKADNLKLIYAHKGTIAALLKQFRDSLPAVDFTKLKAGTAAMIARSLAQATDTLVKAEALMLGKPTERHEVNPGDGWSRLTDEQLAAIAENAQLPPDVSEETLFPPPPPSTN